MGKNIKITGEMRFFQKKKNQLHLVKHSRKSKALPPFCSFLHLPTDTFFEPSSYSVNSSRNPRGDSILALGLARVSVTRLKCWKVNSRAMWPMVVKTFAVAFIIPGEQQWCWLVKESYARHCRCGLSAQPPEMAKHQQDWKDTLENLAVPDKE